MQTKTIKSDKQQGHIVFVIDESTQFDCHLCENLTQRTLNLTIFGKQLSLVIGFVDAPMRICDIVPLAQGLCDKIVAATIAEAELLGWKTPCKKGCWSCCKNIVPVSAPEALWLYEEISRRPKSEQKVLQRSIEFARRKLLAASPPEIPNNTADEKPEQEISDWYSRLGIVCPFLAEKVCQIYRLRPLACREHIVTGNQPCSKQETQVLQLPVSILEATACLCKELGENQTDAIMLPIALQWAQSVKDIEAKTYYASELVDRLIGIIYQQAEAKNSMSS